MAQSNHSDSPLPRYLREYEWDIGERLIAIDHGGSFTAQGHFDKILKLNNVSAGTFDPLGQVSSETISQLENTGNFQLIDDGILADGNNATLYHCNDKEMSGSLPPLSAKLLPHNRRDGANIEKNEPLETMKLDDVDELPRVDWLILESTYDNITLLNNGQQKLAEALAFQIKLPLFPMHKHQATLSDMLNWMEAQGYQCLRFTNLLMQSHFTHEMNLVNNQASQLGSINALFTPNNKRLIHLSPTRLTQLAFLLDNAYNIHDYTYRLLERVDDTMASDYLAAKGYMNLYDGEPDTFELTADYAPSPWGKGEPLIEEYISEKNAAETTS